MDRKARLELASDFDGRWEQYQSYNASRQREEGIALGSDLNSQLGSRPLIVLDLFEARSCPNITREGFFRQHPYSQKTRWNQRDLSISNSHFKVEEMV